MKMGFEKPPEKLGFETTSRRIVKVMGNRRITATVGGKQYHFRSLFEWHWSQYLEFLKQAGEIENWFYENTLFDFTKFNYERGPFFYRPDFLIFDNNAKEYFQECKGFINGDTISKVTRAIKHYDYSKDNFELVVQRVPKKGKGSQRYARAINYFRRIIDASEIFRQMKGMITFDPKFANIKQDDSKDLGLCKHHARR